MAKKKRFRLILDMTARAVCEQRNGGPIVPVVQLKDGEEVRRISRWKFRVVGPEPRLYDMKRRTVLTIRREAGGDPSAVSRSGRSNRSRELSSL